MPVQNKTQLRKNRRKRLDKAIKKYDEARKKVQGSSLMTAKKRASQRKKKKKK